MVARWHLARAISSNNLYTALCLQCRNIEDHYVQILEKVIVLSCRGGFLYAVLVIFRKRLDMYPGLHSIIYLLISVSITRCSLARLVNFTFSSGEQYQKKGHTFYC